MHLIGRMNPDGAAIDMEKAPDMAWETRQETLTELDASPIRCEDWETVTVDNRPSVSIPLIPREDAMSVPVLPSVSEIVHEKAGWAVGGLRTNS